MASNVLVILGAGASFDCANSASTVAADWTPPLARDLFDIRNRPAFESIIKQYPGAQVLASGLADRAKVSGFSLEKRLRELSLHADGQIRSLFEDIPRYLADLLAQISREYTSSAGNYCELLIRLLESNHRIGFVTLNYDSLLEQAVTACLSDHTYARIDDYVASNRKVLIFKVHGSANWFDKMTKHDRDGQMFYKRPPSVGSIEVQYDVSCVNRTIYPVLTAPLANKDESDLVLPRSHQQGMHEFLARTEKVLFVGTSGLDDNVWKALAKDLPRKVRAWSVVDPDAEGTTGRLKQHIGCLGTISSDTAVGVHRMGFGEYLLGDASKSLLDEA